MGTKMKLQRAFSSISSIEIFAKIFAFAIIIIIIIVKKKSAQHL